MKKRIVFFALASLALAACTPAVTPEDLPALPAIDLDGVLPAIRADVESAIRAVESDPMNCDAAGRLAMLLAAYERLDAAGIAYQRARLLAPADPNWAYGHAHLLDWQGETNVALGILIPFENKNVGNQRIVLKIADLNRKSGASERAGGLYERVIDADPDVFEAHFGMARIALADGRAGDAANHLEDAIAIQEGVGELHYALSQAYRSLGRTEDAAAQSKLYEQYKNVEIAEFDPWAQRLSRLNQSDRMHMRRAASHFERGDFESALLELERAVERNPQSISAWTHMVWLYGQAGDYDKAEMSFQSGREIRSDFAPLLINWATVLIRQERYKEAEAALETAVGADPGNAEAHAQLGFVSEELGKVDLAIDAYRGALEIDPEHRRANYLLGRQLALRGEPTEAVQYLERAVEKKTKQTPVYLRTLAGVYQQLGDNTNAVKAIERALVQVPPQSTMASALRDELRLVQTALAEQ